MRVLICRFGYCASPVARLTGFIVVTDRGRVRMGYCQRCRAVVTPLEGETLDEAIDVHAEWHAVMEATAFEIREELRGEGFDV